MNLIHHSLIPEFPKDIHFGWSPVRSDLDPAILSSYDHEEYSSITNTHRRNELLTARHLFDHMNKERGYDQRAGTIRKDEFGKPFIPGNSELGFSFSHTRSMVVAALSNSFTKIGIDIEQQNRNVSEALTDRLVSANERDRLDHLMITEIWTIKESAVKCLGSGIRFNLHDIQIYPESPNKVMIRMKEGMHMTGYHTIWNEHALSVVTHKTT